MWTKSFQMYKLDFKEAEEPEIKLPTFVGSWTKQGSSRKTSASLTVWITTNCGKFLEVRNTRPPYQSPEKPVCRSRSSSGTQNGTTNWFQIGKGIRQGCIFNHAYLTYMQSISHEMPDLMKHKLESRFLREMSVVSDTQMTPPLWQKVN